MDQLSKTVTEQLETFMTEVVKELDRVSEQLDLDRTGDDTDLLQTNADSASESSDEESSVGESRDDHYLEEAYEYAEDDAIGSEDDLNEDEEEEPGIDDYSETDTTE